MYVVLFYWSESHLSVFVSPWGFQETGGSHQEMTGCAESNYPLCGSRHPDYSTASRSWKKHRTLSTGYITAHWAFIFISLWYTIWLHNYLSTLYLYHVFLNTEAEIVSVYTCRAFIGCTLECISPTHIYESCSRAKQRSLYILYSSSISFVCSRCMYCRSILISIQSLKSLVGWCWEMLSLLKPLILSILVIWKHSKLKKWKPPWGFRSASSLPGFIFTVMSLISLNNHREPLGGLATKDWGV